MKAKAIFLFSCMIFAGVAAFCQDSVRAMPGLFPPTSRVFSLNKGSTGTLQPMIILSPDYYATQLGFFCKEEIRFEKATKIPFKFRLGSVNECDQLEGKMNH
jgi:hypothetical protein